MDRTINISVQNRVAWLTNSVEYICGNGDFSVKFAFDDEWDGYEAKTARFSYNGIPIDVPFTGDECPIPKILGARKMEVGVFAGEMFTTTPAMIRCKRSILCGSGVPVAPPADVYGKIMEMIAELKENGGSAKRVTEIDLLAAEWQTEHDGKYFQVKDIPTTTETSRFELGFDAEQLEIMQDKVCTFFARYEDGATKIYCIGDKPTRDYTVQITIEEVVWL